MTLTAFVLPPEWQNEGCSSAWTCVPDIPSTPFTGWLALVDTIRVLVILASLSVILLTPRALSLCVVRGQRARFVAFALWCAAILVAYTEHMGDYPGLRSLITVVGTGYAFFGMISFLWWEQPGQARTRNLPDESPRR